MSFLKREKQKKNDAVLDEAVSYGLSIGYVEIKGGMGKNGK